MAISPWAIIGVSPFVRIIVHVKARHSRTLSELRNIEHMV